MKNHRKILVTGGAGFIGSHIVDRLIERNLETIVYDNLSTGKMENINSEAAFIEGDVLDKRRLNEAMEGIDVVFHEAARVTIRGSVSSFLEDARTNIEGTLNVIQGVINNKVKKFIYASSMAVYGNDLPLPINEDNPLNPISPYGISKLAGENYALTLGDAFGFDAVVLRYFNTFGTRQTLTPYVGVITIFCNRLFAGDDITIFGDGNQIRDFIYVGDLAEASIQAMEREVRGIALNIGSGQGIRIIDLANFLINKINPSLKIKYIDKQKGEPSNSVADISKTRNVLGFTPKHNIYDKIDEVIDYCRHKP